MDVYIILDNSKDCYDAGGIYYGCYLTEEEAEKELSNFSAWDRSDFEIMKESI